MPAKTTIEKIAALMASNAYEKRIAAAIVLGELRTKAPVVVKGLVGMLDSLSHSDYDVAANLRNDRRVGLEAMYTLGFDLIERQNPLGEELLSEVVAKAGRRKIAAMAKNKLKLAGYDD